MIEEVKFANVNNLSNKEEFSEEYREKLLKDQAGSPQQYPSNAWSPFARNVLAANQKDEAMIASSYVTSGNSRITTRFFKGPYFDQVNPEGCRLWSLPGYQYNRGPLTQTIEDEQYGITEAYSKALTQLQKEIADAKKTGSPQLEDLEKTYEYFNNPSALHLGSAEATSDGWKGGLLTLHRAGALTKSDMMKLTANPSVFLKGKTKEEILAARKEVLDGGVKSYTDFFLDKMANTPQLHETDVEDEMKHEDLNYQVYTDNKKLISDAKDVLQKKFGLDTVNEPIDVYNVLTKDWMNPDENSSIWGTVKKELGLQTNQTLKYSIPKQFFELMAPAQNVGPQPGDWMDEEFGLEGFNRYELAMCGFVGDANPMTRMQIDSASGAMARRVGKEGVERFLSQIPRMNSQMAGASLVVASITSLMVGTLLIHMSIIRSRDHYWTLFKLDNLLSSLPDTGYHPTEAQIHQDVRFKTWMTLPFLEDEDEF